MNNGDPPPPPPPPTPTNGTEPPPPPPAPPSPPLSLVNDTEFNIEAVDRLTALAEPNTDQEIICLTEIKIVVQQMIRDAALLAGAGQVAAEAGNFPFNFFLASYNLTARNILSRAENALLNRGMRTIYTCYDWNGVCEKAGVRAWAGQRRRRRLR